MAVSAVEFQSVAVKLYFDTEEVDGFEVHSAYHSIFAL